MHGGQASDTRQRLIAVTLDEASIGRSSPEIEHERAAAIHDLVEENNFAVPAHEGGPYALALSMAENRLVFAISEPPTGKLVTHLLSLTPLRKTVRDYFLICESYDEAVRAGSPGRVEAIDMGRRGLHDEGARLLVERLAGKVDIDFATARRLFTLICALHWKG